MELRVLRIRAGFEMTDWRRCVVLAALPVATACGDSPTSPNGPCTPSNDRQIDVTVGSAGATLAARGLLPASNAAHPVVVMVRGSDRWRRLGFDTFTAHFLDRGIAVWSYDRRGVGASTGTYDNDVNVFPNYADDLVANLRAAAGLFALSCCHTPGTRSASMYS